MTQPFSLSIGSKKPRPILLTHFYKWPSWPSNTPNKREPFAEGPWQLPHKFHLYLILFSLLFKADNFESKYKFIQSKIIEFNKHKTFVVNWKRLLLLWQNGTSIKLKLLHNFQWEENQSERERERVNVWEISIFNCRELLCLRQYFFEINQNLFFVVRVDKFRMLLLVYPSFTKNWKV